MGASVGYSQRRTLCSIGIAKKGDAVSSILEFTSQVSTFGKEPFAHLRNVYYHSSVCRTLFIFILCFPIFSIRFFGFFVLFCFLFRTKDERSAKELALRNRTLRVSALYVLDVYTVIFSMVQNQFKV